jgi:gamma-butyrobetaine dioxygenase
METASGDPVLHGLAAIWLRDSCGCAECRDAGSGQRLVSITDLPADVWLATTRAVGDSIEVVFGPDRHRGVFSRDSLAEQDSPPEDDRTEDAKRLWAAGDFAAGIPERSWPRYLGSEADRAECLSALLRDGFFLLRDVPCQPGTVLTVAASMGFVRETNYGRLFDVRVEATPTNLAFTGLPIAPHTDNPYRDPVPTVQLLHCLATAADGGDSGLVDGFMAAAQLRAADPSAFEVQQPFHAAAAPGTRRAGRAGRAGKGGKDTRVLHARTGFDPAGERHPQGCYADLDGVASTLAVLRRSQEASR